MHQQFMAIYDSLFDDIYRYVFVRIGARWDADDLVSEIFRKALEAYSPKIQNPSAWLFRIARNTVTDFYRKKRELPLGGGVGESRPGEINFELDVETRERVLGLRKCLSKLSQKDLDLISLHYFAGMTYKDIGRLLHRSEGSVKMRVMRAKNRLGVLMKDEMEG